MTDDRIIHVAPWPNEPADWGYPVTDVYLELFWTPIVGPTCVAMLRHLDRGLQLQAAGFETTVADLAGHLGLQPRANGKDSPTLRSIARLDRFGLAQWYDPLVMVRRRAPVVNRGQLDRLPADLQAWHDALTHAEAVPR